MAAARPAAKAARQAPKKEAPKLRVVETDHNYADVGEVEDFAELLPEKFLHCREMNHNWRPFTVGRHKDGGYARVLRCVRCKTRKTQHLDGGGMIVGGAKYEHPDGYLHKGMGRIVGEGRGALRLESIKRIVAKSGEDL